MNKNNWIQKRYCIVYNNGFQHIDYYGPVELGWKYLDWMVEDNTACFTPFEKEK